MEGYQWGGEQSIGEQAQGIRSIIDRHKVDSRRLRVV